MLLLVVLVFGSIASVVAQDFSELPAQPANTPWPKLEWPRAALSSGINGAALEGLAQNLMDTEQRDTLGETYALVVVHGGKIVLERYSDGYACDRITHSMSIAKMVGAVLAAVMEEDGYLSLTSPAPISAWSDAEGDPRAQITPEHLLRMTNGQKWNELWNFLELAFGEGISDLAAYAISRPAAYPPGTHFQYSDATPGLISYLLREQTGWGPDEMADYFRKRIFDRVDMRTTEPEFDAHGTWYGSSGIRWSPCDLARFALMLLRDGVWADSRILPQGWVNRMRTPSAASLAVDSEMRAYGAGYGYTTFVYDLDPEATPVRVDAFGHLGFGGHVLRIVPSRDLIVILLGNHAMGDLHLARLEYTRKISEAFPPLANSR